MFLVLANLILAGFALAFFALAPPLHLFPLKPPQTPRLIELVLPVFLGYLGAAAQFVFRHGELEDSEAKVANGSPLGTVLIVGPVALFALAWASILIAFAISNGKAAPEGAGMDIDQLATYTTWALSVMTVVTNSAVPFLFPRQKRRATRGRRS
jgi:hypothetical protein